MELFVKTVFWIGFFGFIGRVITMGERDWPYVEKKSLGLYVSETLANAAFTAWAAALIWMR